MTKIKKLIFSVVALTLMVTVFSFTGVSKVFAAEETEPELTATETEVDVVDHEWREVQFNMGNDYKTYLKGDRLYLVNDDNYTFNPTKEKLYLDEDGIPILSALDTYLFIFNKSQMISEVILNDNEIISIDLPEDLSVTVEEQEIIENLSGYVSKLFDDIFMTNINDLEAEKRYLENKNQATEFFRTIEIISEKQKVVSQRIYIQLSTMLVPDEIIEDDVVVNEEHISMIKLINAKVEYLKHTTNFYKLEKGYWYLDMEYIKENMQDISYNASAMFGQETLDMLELEGYDLENLTEIIYNLFPNYNDLEYSVDGGKTYKSLHSQNKDEPEYNVNQHEIGFSSTQFSVLDTGFVVLILDSNINEPSKPASLKTYILTENDKLRFKAQESDYDDIGGTDGTTIPGFVKENKNYFIIGSVVLVAALAVAIIAATSKNTAAKKKKKR